MVLKVIEGFDLSTQITMPLSAFSKTSSSENKLHRRMYQILLKSTEQVSVFSMTKKSAE